MTRKIVLIAFSLVVAFLLSTPLIAQDKEQPKSNQRQRAEESEDHYKKWLEEEVAYIIAPDERAVFEKLTTDDERDRFIEQFWLRRDPDPRSSANEYKLEHYRRIQYANEQFHAGIPGWKTDRGRIYIMFGPPDRKESYPMGGWYERKEYEGGGPTHVFPFERWEYYYIEGVGSDVELEFVDASGSNMYRLTLDSQEKDEFRHVPGLGPTLKEAFHPGFGGRKSRDRVVGIRESGYALNQGISERVKDLPFQKAELMLRIGNAPAIRYNDLQELVKTEIYYEQFPFQVETHLIHLGGMDYLAAVTVSFDQEVISFSETDNGYRSRLQIYGLVRTMTRKFVTEFDDDIQLRLSPREFQQMRTVPGIYQKKLALKPGKYKLNLILKDTESLKTGTTVIAIDVPRPKDELGISSVFLTKQIESSSEPLSEPYVVGNYKVRPNVSRSFRPDEYLGFYFEIYDFLVDQASGQPEVQVEYTISGKDAFPDKFRTVNRVTLATDRLYVARLVQLINYTPGDYQLYFRVTDRLGERTVITRTPFQIEAPESTGEE